jgi:hypothetical protein
LAFPLSAVLLVRGVRAAFSIPVEVPARRTMVDMSEMIRSFGIGGRYEACSSFVTLDVALKWLSGAHRILRQQGRLALQEAARIPAGRSWGSAVKRQRVPFPSGRIPILAEIESVHNLIEVVNMCATLERLLDTISWLTETRLNSYLVEHCHPTTGSSRQRRDSGHFDNDLVLVKSTRSEVRARVEVSDIIGPGDSNRKFSQDLKRLGVLDENGHVTAGTDRWPKDRVFIASSKEPRPYAGVQYVRHNHRTTVITEVTAVS